MKTHFAKVTLLSLIIVHLALAGLLLLAGTVWGAPGDSLWTKEFNIPSYPTLSINAMAVSPTTVIICGNASGGTAPGAPQQIGFIRAFQVTTGDLKWWFDLAPFYKSDFRALTTDGGLVLALGTTLGWSPGSLSKSIVRACNTDTGQLSWEAQQDCYQSGVAQSTSTAQTLMATANNRTFLATIAPKPDEPAMPGNCVVQAFQERAVVIPSTLLLD